MSSGTLSGLSRRSSLAATLPIPPAVEPRKVYLPEKDFNDGVGAASLTLLPGSSRLSLVVVRSFHGRCYMTEPYSKIDAFIKSNQKQAEQSTHTLNQLKAKVQRLSTAIASLTTVSRSQSTVLSHTPVTPQHAITTTPSRTSTARSSILTRGAAALSLEEDLAKRRLFGDETPRASGQQATTAYGSVKRKRTASATNTA